MLKTEFNGNLQNVLQEWNKQKQIHILQDIVKLPQNKEEAQICLQELANIIKNDVCANTGICKQTSEFSALNQVALNLIFRSYYQILYKFDIDDKHFANLSDNLLASNAIAFHMLSAVLLTDHGQQLEANTILNLCTTALEKAVRDIPTALLIIIKALNLLLKNFPKLDLHLTLENIYLCLQNKQIGIREETLTVFQHCCKSAKRALHYFQMIIEFWPWTNRNKLYLLSGILNLHALPELLASINSDASELFAGLRLSLSYKHLLAASQYLVKSLNAQQSTELLDLSVKILMQGSLREIDNFYAQWFNRFSNAQKDLLFERLQKQPEMLNILEQASSNKTKGNILRSVLIFNMFARQIFIVSRLHFFKISTEHITNCFQYDIDTQLVIFRFFVDNFSNFSIEDGLEFIVYFCKMHKSVENARFRNNLLGQLPTIINYVSKAFNKLNEGSTLSKSILNFFTQLQEQVECNIGSKEYQSQIFAMKLLEIVIKSLYAKEVQKNAKLCSVAQNQQLGVFLIQEHVFNEQKVRDLLLQQLNNPHGFDDAMDLCVSLLQQLQYAQADESFARCLQFCQRLNVDECALSTLHAKVAVSTFRAAKVPEKCLSLYEKAFESLENELDLFKADPLLVCRTRNHLFGYMCVINEIILAESWTEHDKLLNCLWNVLQVILDLLNIVNVNNSHNMAADFQHMDESLQIIIEKSKFNENEHTQCRKFLLMSFWFTLKACCNVAEAVGSQIVSKWQNTEKDVGNLSKCLDIHMTVLTRCRHKGAIECAGLSIGKLTKNITSNLDYLSSGYRLLFAQIDILFADGNKVSTTRRGAGFSIMLLHIVKNEVARHRPILQYVMQKILLNVQDATMDVANASNYDRLDALTLHYLCVLVKDTELRYSLSHYYSDIMLAAIQQIDHIDWTVCNAALQLFGALVPKIVGQKQSMEIDQPLDWEPTEITYSEILHKLPKSCAHILNYCSGSDSATRSLILYLGFLANVEHLYIGADDGIFLQQLRSLFWQLLAHSCEKVRKLSAMCFVRAHELRCGLPQVLLAISKLLLTIRDENFFLGLVFTLMDGVTKLRHEAQYTLKSDDLENILHLLNLNLGENFTLLSNFKPYTLCKFAELIHYSGASSQLELIKKCLEYKTNEIGYDLCVEQLMKFMSH